MNINDQNLQLVFKPLFVSTQALKWVCISKRSFKRLFVWVQFWVEKNLFKKIIIIIFWLNPKAYGILFPEQNWTHSPCIEAHSIN